MRGIRIFDITDIAHPRHITERADLPRLAHPHRGAPIRNDTANVYVYVSGSAPVRSPNELAGCSRLAPDRDPNSALFRIEVIKVPLAHPEQAHIVSSPRIFDDLTGAGRATARRRRTSPPRPSAVAEARARGAYTATVQGQEIVAAAAGSSTRCSTASCARASGTGAATAADSAALRAGPAGASWTGSSAARSAAAPRPGPIAVPRHHRVPGDRPRGRGVRRATGCCSTSATRRTRGASPAVADSNFSYWHSATFSNDGTKMLFSDEWGGGSQPRCRATDKPEWGADAIFTLSRRAP